MVWLNSISDGIGRWPNETCWRYPRTRWPTGGVKADLGGRSVYTVSVLSVCLKHRNLFKKCNCLMQPVLRIWIRDPGSGAFWPLDPGSGIGFFRIPDLGFRIPDPKTIFLRVFWQLFLVKSFIIFLKLPQISFLLQFKAKIIYNFVKLVAT